MPVECGWGREIASERECKEVQLNYRVLNNLLPLNVSGMPLQCEWYQSRAIEDRFFTARTRVQTNTFFSRDATRVRVIPVEVTKGIFAVWRWCDVSAAKFVWISQDFWETTRFINKTRFRNETRWDTTTIETRLLKLRLVSVSENRVSFLRKRDSFRKFN